MMYNTNNNSGAQIIIQVYIAAFVLDMVTLALLYLPVEPWHRDLQKTHVPYKCAHTTVPTIILLHFAQQSVNM